MRILVRALLAGSLSLLGCSSDGAEPVVNPEVSNPGNGNSGGSGGSGGRTSGGSSGRAGAGGSAGSAGSGSGGSAGATMAGSGGSAGASGGAAGSPNPDPAPPDADPADPGSAPADAGSADMAPAASGEHYPGHPGVRSIFDGKTMTGWEGPASVWKVRDGLLVGGGQRGQATTTENYGTFRLIVSSRLSRGNDHLGVCLWGTKRVFDCLLVIPPSGSIYDYVSNRTERGVMYDPEAKRTWHETEIIANLQTGLVKVAVDGKARPDYTDRMIARRKAGPIGLQLHSGGIEVEFRGIYIEKDPANDTFVTVKP